MSYQVLARKWRPKRFADLVGQEHVVRALSNALADNRLHHAYLLTGTRGVGKTTIARILAKSLNCETGVTAEPCGVCSACTQIDAGRFVDLLEIDAASNTGIDNIREVLENAQYAPSAGRFKVYIIDEVHMLSKSAFNAMLKTLEEPPSHVKFILATTDPQKVPVTVLSRCLQFSLRNMTPQQVAAHLAHVLDIEAVPYEVPALALLGRAAAGSMRDALSLLDQAIAYGVGRVEESGVRAMLGAVDRRYLFTLLDALAAGEGPRLIAESEALAERGIGFDSALAEIAALLQQIALYQTVPAALPDDEPERDAIVALASALSPEDVQLYYQIALHGRKDLPLAPDEHAGFSMTLLRMLAFRPLSLDVVASEAPAAPVATRPIPVSPTLGASAAHGGGQGAAAARAALARAGGRDDSQRVARPSEPRDPEPEPARSLTAEKPAVTAQPVRQPEPLEEPVDLPWVADSEPPPPPPPPEEWGEPVSAPAQHEELRRAESAVTAKPEPVTAVEPPRRRPPSDAGFDDWGALALELAPQLGAAQMLALNAVLLKREGIHWTFAVSKSFANTPATNRDRVEKLRSVLSEHLGEAIQVELVAQDDAGDTPAMQRARYKEEQLVAAEASLRQDPVVKAMEREFGATLLTDTIQPIQE
ncbi:DNA polymerase III subunit gamma/tau [Crenobacter sp. SG2303]|uniref:DNA polymerase III subunit gamma/tau n=1 Tax=Crenobacter oryzisoli TaxID=3056844 RepID=A0ABT7XSN9_9NEIS|nr:DNA polymerase III subunit gamma/tau [Crenobacter sp. SG2303]MDN0076554.1 DNA polymerase III subunit gamma/tau [Crenobacter sp. SG2303]